MMRYFVAVLALGAFGAWGAEAQVLQAPGEPAVRAVAEPGHRSAPGMPGGPIRIRCLAVPAEIIGGSADEREAACSAAQAAAALLGRCGVVIRRTLRIEFAAVVRNPFGAAIFGRYDIRNETVLITQEANIPPLAQDTIYAKLPTRAFFNSLIVHEVVHAVMQQNYRRQPDSHAMHEYPAYALQIESLPPALRNALLRAAFERVGAGKLLFNDVLLSFDPPFFAASAYEHFKSSRDQCGLLNALLIAEAEFITTLPP